MKRVKGEAEEKGVRGLASATKIGDDKLRVVFEDNKGTFLLTVGEDTLPEYFPFSKMRKEGTINISATMNKEGTKILFANPASGEYEARFNKMVAPEGQEPVAETKPGTKGKPYKQFAVLIEIVGVKKSDGITSTWKGANLYKPLYPNFAPDEDGNLAISGGGSGSDTLYDFLEATGVSNHNIPFSDNPLPEIQRIAQKENRTFKVILQKGWIDMIIPPMLDDAFELEDDFFEEKSTETKETKDDASVPAALQD